MACEKAKELFKDKSFLEELAKAETAEEAQKLFTDKGAEISIEELMAFRASVMQEAGEELSDEDLALVAGGGSGLDFIPDMLIPSREIVDFFKGIVKFNW